MGVSQYKLKTIKLCAAALDPTQPGFEGFSSEVMLHKGDANFIDVIHTDSNPFIPMLGFGMTLPAGKLFQL